MLTEPVDISRYAFYRMPQKDQWGVLVLKDSPLAEKKGVAPEDLVGIPLLLSGREKVRSELANWFGDDYIHIEIAATYNLILNAANMVKNGVGAALCFRLENISNSLRFVPLSPKLETDTVLAWKKNQIFSPVVEQFHQHIKYTRLAFLLIQNRYSTYCFNCSTM
ncbi:LysR family transcriptional regulator substrate-binding protein [Anaerotruncus colihominis]|uniref:LysR family transcriptional regulator substrate-binding protein n=1 Tax=Anaerotruncus colihominis TaxID=169435 RepID=UPI0026953AE2